MKKYLSLIAMIALICCLGIMEAEAAWKVVAGNSHALAIKPDGTLWAWGKNNEGQLGLGDGTTRKVPVQVGTATNWVAVAAGEYHSLALKSDGTLWTWGRNNEGQLGLGDTTNRNVPTKVGSATNWSTIYAGYGFTHAIKTDGTLWAWGTNTNGQLGIGSTANRSSPVQVGTDTNWAGVAGGANHVLGRKTNNSLWAWGNNNYGQLGSGDAYQRTSPVQVGTATSWIHVVAGSRYSLARRSNGTLWAWGLNDYGQLGIGNTTDQIAPVQVGTATNWANIMECSSGGVIAVKTNGTRWGWGRNLNGVFGSSVVAVDATSNVPLQLDSGTNWIAVSSKFSSGYYLKSDETLWSAGYNIYGQLGNGTTSSSSVPVKVLFPRPFSGSIALTCPATMFLGDTQSCTAVIPNQEDMPISITWSMTDMNANLISGDTITDQGNAGLTYSAHVHPVSVADRKVTALACLNYWPAMCSPLAETTMQVMQGTITIGDLIGPSQLEWMEHGTVEVPSVTTSLGTYTGSWTITGEGAQNTEATPTGENVAAREVWSTSTTGGTVNLTYTATSNEDPELSASKSFSITTNSASISMGDLLGTPTLEVGQHGIVEVPSVTVTFGSYTGAWNITGAAGQSQEATPTGTNVAALEVWGSEAGEMLVSYTATSTLDPDVTATKYFVVVVNEASGGGDPGVSDVAISCPDEVIVGQQFTCMATVNVSPEYARTYRWSYGGGGGRVSPGSNDEETLASFTTIGDKTITLGVSVTETNTTITGSAAVTVTAKPVLSAITIEGEKEIPIAEGESLSETYAANATCPTGRSCEITWTSGSDTGTGESFDKTITLPGKYVVSATIRVTDIPPEMKIEKSATMAVTAYLVTEPKLSVTGIPVMTREGTPITATAVASGKLTPVVTWTYPGGNSTGSTLEWTPTEPGDFEITCEAHFEGYEDKVAQKSFQVTVVRMADIAELGIVRRPMRELYAPTSVMLYPQVVINQEVPLVWERYVTKGATYNWTVNGVTEGTSTMFRRTFNEQGEYTIALEVLLADGRTLSATQSLTVNPPLPITAKIRQSIRRATCLEEPRSGYFRGITTGGVVRSRITIAKWYLDDQEIASGSILRKIFDEPGLHYLRWEVENNYGQAGVAQAEVEVTEETPPGIDFRMWKSNSYDRAPLGLVVKAYPTWGCNNKEKLFTFGWKVDGQIKSEAIGYTLQTELTAGDHAIEFTATTESGREIADTTVVSVHDNLSPECSAIEVTDDVERQLTTWTVNCADVDSDRLSYEWKVGDIKTGRSLPTLILRTTETQQLSVSVTVRDLNGGETAIETTTDIVRGEAGH